MDVVAPNFATIIMSLMYPRIKVMKVEKPSKVVALRTVFLTESFFISGKRFPQLTLLTKLSRIARNR